MVKINFNTPLTNDQQIPCIHGFKSLGFSVERIYTNDVYILYRFYGRLPTGTGSSDVDVLFTESAKQEFKTLKNVNFVEIYLMFERKKK